MKRPACHHWFAAHCRRLALPVLFFCLAPFVATPAASVADSDSIKDEARTYHVFDDVDLVSTLKFQYARPRIVVKSVYPQLQSESFNESIDAFNELVADFVQQKVDDFKSNVSQNQETRRKLPKSIFKNDLYIDFATSFLRSGKNPIISIRFNIQGNIAGMAHPYHHHHALNFDLENGNTLELSDLFKPDADYLQILSAYTRDELRKRHLRDTQLLAGGTEPKAENFKNWNLKPNGLLITFDEYQVAPYVDGAQTVLVPFSILSDLIAPDSPIAGCVTHKKRCTQSNVLTGGFIDEASAPATSAFAMRKTPAISR